MGQGEGQGFGIVRFSDWAGGLGGEFAKNRVDEGGGGMLAGALYQFDALVESGAFGHAIEPSELVKREAEGEENLKVEFCERLRGCGRDFMIEARAPTENAHDQFRGQGVILG